MLRYEDLLKFQDWLQSCGQFPASVQTGPPHPLPDAEIDRLLKEAGLVDAKDLGARGEIKLSREQKCMLGLRKAARWKCDRDCAAPWLPKISPFVFVKRTPSLPTLIQTCDKNRETYQTIFGRKMPSEAKWKSEVEKLRKEQIDKLALYERASEAKFKQDEAALERKRSWTTAQREAKDKSLAALRASHGKFVRDLQARMEEEKKRPLPDYHREMEQEWHRGCETATPRYRADLARTQRAAQECFERINKRALLPSDEKALLPAALRQRQISHTLTTGDRREIRSIQTLMKKKLTSKQQETIQTYFQSLKTQLDREQKVEELCMTPLVAGHCAPPENEYRTLEYWNNLQDIRKQRDLFETRCREVIRSALKGEHYQGLIR